MEGVRRDSMNKLDHRPPYQAGPDKFRDGDYIPKALRHEGRGWDMADRLVAHYAPLDEALPILLLVLGASTLVALLLITAATMAMMLRQ